MKQSLTLADIVAVRRVGLVLRGHHDMPGCHPGLCLQTEALHTTAETNTQRLSTNITGRDLRRAAVGELGYLATLQ